MDLRIGVVPRAKTILDVAFGRARQSVLEAKRDIFKRQHEHKVKRIENIRIQVAASNVCAQLQSITDAFPTYDHLAPFYRELLKATLDLVVFKESLGALKWAAQRTRALQRQFAGQIEKSRMQQLHTMRAAFFGRVSSVVDQIDDALQNLEDARKILKRFPTIKTSIPTVVIAGMPNAGKSTLLRALTGSEPEIKPYPFTTKNIMLGYRGVREAKIQFVDTPGLLDRPLSERNPIEKQTILALTHIARVVLFIIDASGTGGYTVKAQLDLLREIRKEFDMPFIVVANKMDISGAKPIKDTFSISAENGDGINDVATAVEEAVAKATQKTSPEAQTKTQ